MKKKEMILIPWKRKKIKEIIVKENNKEYHVNIEFCKEFGKDEMRNEKGVEITEKFNDKFKITFYEYIKSKN